MAQGGSATFSVGISGTTPLAYQWEFINDGVTNILSDGPFSNGGVISGSATSKLTISSAATANAGNYQVIVSNSHGIVTSSLASLTVNP